MRDGREKGPYIYSLPSGERGNGSRAASCLARGVEMGEDVRWRQGDSSSARLTAMPESSESWLTSTKTKYHWCKMHASM